MNELGAGFFDRYADSSGAALTGAAIGTWDEVAGGDGVVRELAPEAAFTLGLVPGARLYRGREVVGGRLAWAGFGYSLQPGPPSFSYTVRIGRMKVRP